MRKILFFCALIILYTLPVFGASLAGGYPVCVTKELYQLFLKNCILQENEKDCQFLLNAGCFILPEKTEVTVLEQSAWTMNAKVRISTEYGIIIGWTHVKNIKKE